MIASLRNGLADGLSVTRHHRAVSAVRYRSRHIHLSLRTPDGLSWRLHGYVAFHPMPPGSRLISSTPPPPTQTPAKDVPHPIAGAPARKHKVDLRPGPVKSVKASPETLSPSTPSASNVQESAPTISHSSTEATSSHHHPTHSNSVLETAKEDLYDASKHGILAPPPENASWAGKLFHQAKELFKFYWNGVKLINTHRLHVRKIEARVKAGGAPISRWETRFIANYKQDALKLIPFMLIVIIAEEVIPLVVIYAPFLLPSTCLLPSQKERITTKKREKQQYWAENMALVFREVHQRALSEPALSAESLLDRSALRSYNGIFALSTFGFPSIRLHRVKKHIAGLIADDALLARENWGERLNALELREALEDRGIVAEGLTTDDMRNRLQWWLAEATRTDIDPLRQRILLVAANVVGKHE